MMTPHGTMLANLTDEELVRHLDEAAGYSSVIRELCKRLENKDEEMAGMNTRTECPVCQAQIEVEADIGNTRYVLKAVI